MSRSLFYGICALLYIAIQSLGVKEKNKQNTGKELCQDSCIESEFCFFKFESEHF